MKHTLAVAALGALVLSGVLSGAVVGVGAQQPSAAPSAVGPAAPVGPSELVLGPGNFLHVVADAEKAIAFYRDALGMEVQMAPNAQPGPRPYLTTPEIVRLYDATGGKYRTATAFVQGSPMRAELVEWAGVDRKPIAPRYQDPGAATMIVTVRDLDTAIDKVRIAGGRMVSDEGRVVPFADERGRGRAVMVQDLDGFYVQLVQREVPPPTQAPATANAIDIGFAVTVDDMDRSLAIFNDVLGFGSLRRDAEEHNDARLHMIGLFTAYYNRYAGSAPGSNLQFELIEVQGLDRRHFNSRPQDPGSALLRLRVTDIQKATELLARRNVKLVSTDGMPVTVVGAQASQRFAMFRTPDNLFLQLVQPLPAAAPTTR